MRASLRSSKSFVNNMFPPSKIRQRKYATQFRLTTNLSF